MILKELFYFDDKTLEPTEDNRYDSSNDDSVIKPSDSRKSKLTLKDINKVRKASDQHKIEQEEDLNFVKQMYGIAANTEQAGI
jgi:hypothetical protein